MQPPLPKRRRIVSEKGDLVRGLGRSQGYTKNRRESEEQNDVKAISTGGRAIRHVSLSDPAVEISSDDDEEDAAAMKKAYSSLLDAIQVPAVSDRPAQNHYHKRGLMNSVDINSNDEQNHQSPHSEFERIDYIDNEGLEEEHINQRSNVENAEDSDNESLADSFVQHFANPDYASLVRNVNNVNCGNYHVLQRKNGPARVTSMIPASVVGKSNTTSDSLTRKVLWKKRLSTRLKNDAKLSGNRIADAFGSDVFAYRDLMYCGRTVANAQEIREISCAHVLNHILKTRDQVIKQTARLARDQGHNNLELRDQGFTRPKILILLETRNACAKYVKTISEIFDPDQQENKTRFEDAFVDMHIKFSEDRPADFRELFEGNDDNEFRLGVKFTRKTIKYYAQFYNSDIILASPLGLRRAINAEDSKKVDFDFLSSIEILIMDQADAMLMQNWEHVEFILEHLNLQPKQSHGCDFSRVRQWYLDGHSRYLRQTLVFSQYLTPELNGLFSSYMQNVAGKLKVMPTFEGKIVEVDTRVCQTFSRYHSRSPIVDPDDRFKYFTTTIVPFLNRELPSSGQGLGALIFVPSYLDFVRIRNYFSTSQDTQNLTFGSLSEYTDVSDSRRGRSFFFAGKQNVMLYTGRAHHFRRYQLRGVKKVIMYGIPENPTFYHELVEGFLGQSVSEGLLDSGDAIVKIIFSKWDGLALERIVGTKRVKRMLNDSGEDVFEFR